MEPSERFRRAQSVFHTAVHLDRAGRERALSEGCAGEPELRAYIERLLAAHDRSTWISPDLGETLPVEPEPLRRNDRVGSYQVIERLGEGGMGTVYLAEQREPFRRRVALKVVKAGMDSKAVLARFEAERQALALMEHPNIARILDAGATGDGRPYFAMELVQGEPITTYCDRHELSNRERIALFIPVCQAVQHAHQKGIIHRDLKPSNILVTMQDGHPVPKVIDFGIAKAISVPLGGLSVHTHLGQILGTPEYMSPEQAEMGALDVDTRSDIYSLGTVLYELLTGSLPFSRETLRKAGYLEIQRIIREVEPPRPSTRISTLGASATDLAKKRQTDVRRLARDLQRDLDWVLLKTLEKDRTRRYGAAHDLAAELERYLRNEPVLAGPPGVAYRARKLIARHKTAVVITTTVLAAIVISAAALAWSLVQANTSRRELAAALDTATQALDESEAVQGFMARMFGAIRPENDGADVSVREMLDSAAVRVDVEFAKHPVVAARTHYLLGDLFGYIGALEESRDQYALCLKIRREALGPEHRATLQAWEDWATTLSWVGGVGTREESLKQLREALTLAERNFGEKDTVTLEIMGSMGNVLMYGEQKEEAEVVLRRALGIATSMERLDYECWLNNQLGIALFRLGRHSEALAAQQAEIAAATALYGADHPTTLTATRNLATTHMELGHLTEAESLLTRDLGRMVRIYGPESEMPGNAYANLTTLQIRKGDLRQALFWAEKTAAWRETQKGSDAPNTLYWSAVVAGLRCQLGEGKAFLVPIERALERINQLKDIDEAERSKYRASVLKVYGKSLATLKDYSRAERAYVEAYEASKSLGEGRAQTREIAKELVAFYETTGKKEEAARLREKDTATQGL